MNAKQIESGRKVVGSINNLFSLWDGAMDSSRMGEVDDAIDTLEFFLELSHWKEEQPTMYLAVNDIIVAAYDMDVYRAVSSKMFVEMQMELYAWRQDGTRDCGYLSRKMIPIVVNNIANGKVRV